MKVGGFQHVNIWSWDIPATLAFYEQVLDIRPGPRPPIRTPGLWLYNPDGVAAIHVYDGVAAGREPASGSGVVDHVAFSAEGFEETMARLERLGQPHRVSTALSGIRQVFVTDPNGLTIELNFAAATPDPG